MKHNNVKKLLRAGVALVLAITLCAPSTYVYADNKVDRLEQETSDLQNELNTLNQKLNKLSSEVNNLTTKIQATEDAIAKTSLDLSAAKLNQEIQYKSMKKRIQYMYEKGNNSLLHLLCSSQSMSEFLNNTEFVKNVTEYDRNMLMQLQEEYETIEQKEKDLKKEKKELKELQASIDSQKQELRDAISSTSSQLSASSSELEEAKRAAEEAIDRSENDDTETNPVEVPSTEASRNELVLFAAILQCEAGSTNYDALLAVATVIMNRLESSRFPNTLHGVIYQSGQFSPTWNGSLNRVLAAGPANLCYKVARDALAGKRLGAVSHCYFFNAAWTGKQGINIGGNVFY